ncbi:hypothetical protein KO481_25775 [Nocardia sp. NEAU-G5]|uniref:Outer membrane channel protein CpnT-like N-terminal domain-containing protein n=1 Tax=Nocardia albiluteola TaxID=2842303 RepID=A0ABS6B3P4_9NOCA|nr:hypothetical protein [Nocardia albiluteola]MBU3064927.1 hypothetical protein [Nocardia albiluteola]
MSWARLPSWLWPTAEILNFGQSYPNGDPDQMRAFGDQWSGLADQLEGWIDAIKNAVQDVGAHLVGESEASFHQQSDYMISDGQTNLESTVASMRQVQGMTYNAATSIDYTQQLQDFFCAMTAYQVAQLAMTAAGNAAAPGVYAAFRQLVRLAFQDCSEVVARDAEADAIAAMLAEQMPKVFEHFGTDISQKVAQDLGEKAAQTIGRDGLSTIGRDAAGDLGASAARHAGEDLVGQGARIAGRDMAADVAGQGGRAAARDVAADFVGQAGGAAGRHALVDLATDGAGDIARRQLGEAAARDGAGLITKVGGDAAEKAAAKLPLKAIGQEAAQDAASAAAKQAADQAAKEAAKKAALKELAKSAAHEGFRQARQGAALDLAIQADQIVRGQRSGFDTEQFLSTALSWGGGVVLGHPAGEVVGKKLAQEGFVTRFLVGTGVAAALNVPGMALGDTAGRALFQAGEAGLGVLDPTGGHQADWSHLTSGLNPQQFLAIGAMHGLGMVNSDLAMHKGIVAPADFHQINEMFGNLAVRSTAPDATGPDDGFRQDYQHRLGKAYAEARAHVARSPRDPVPLKKFQRLRQELDARQGVTSDRRTGEVPKPSAGPANRTTEVTGRGGATGGRGANDPAGTKNLAGDPARGGMTGARSAAAAAGPVVSHRAESAVSPSESAIAAGPGPGRAEVSVGASADTQVPNAVVPQSEPVAVGSSEGIPPQEHNTPAVEPPAVSDAAVRQPVLASVAAGGGVRAEPLSGAGPITSSIADAASAVSRPDTSVPQSAAANIAGFEAVHAEVRGGAGPGAAMTPDAAVPQRNSSVAGGGNGGSEGAPERWSAGAAPPDLRVSPTAGDAARPPLETSEPVAGQIGVDGAGHPAGGAGPAGPSEAGEHSGVPTSTSADAAGLPYRDHGIGEAGPPGAESPAGVDSHGVVASGDHVDAEHGIAAIGRESAGYGDLHEAVVDARAQADQRWIGALADAGVDVAAADPAAVAALRDAAANDHAFVGRNGQLDRGPRDAARREFADAARAVGIDVDATDPARLRALRDTAVRDRETQERLDRLNRAAETVGDEADPALLAYARAMVAHHDASVRFDEATADLPEHAAWLLRSPANRFGAVDTLTRLLSGGNGIELTDAQRAELHDAVIGYQLTGIESATARAHIDAAHAAGDGSESDAAPPTGQLRRGLSGTLPGPVPDRVEDLPAGATAEPSSAATRRPADELAGMDGSVPRPTSGDGGEARAEPAMIPGSEPVTGTIPRRPEENLRPEMATGHPVGEGRRAARPDLGDGSRPPGPAHDAGGGRHGGAEYGSGKRDSGKPGLGLSEVYTRESGDEVLPERVLEPGSADATGAGSGHAVAEHDPGSSHTEAPEHRAPGDAAKNAECGIRALRRLLLRFGERSGIRLPARLIGVEGMSRDELVGATGGRLEEQFTRHTDVADRVPDGGAALVVDMYGRSDGNRVGGHAYLLWREGDRITVEDLGTGEVHEDLSRLSDDVESIGAIFLDHEGVPVDRIDEPTRERLLREAQEQVAEADWVGVGRVREPPGSGEEQRRFGDHPMPAVLRFLAQHGVEHAADPEAPLDPADPGYVPRLIEAIGLREALGNHPDPSRALRELAEEVRVQGEIRGARGGEFFGPSEKSVGSPPSAATPRVRSPQNAREELLRGLGLRQEDLASADRGNILEQLKVRNILRAAAIEALADHALRADAAATPEEGARLGAIRDDWARRLGANAADFETPTGAARRLADLRAGVIQRAHDIADLVALDTALHDPEQQGHQIVVELGRERVRLRVESDDAGGWRVVDEVPRESVSAEHADDAAGAGRKSWLRRLWQGFFAPPIRPHTGAPSGSGSALPSPPHGEPHPDIASGGAGMEHGMSLLDHLSAVNDFVTKLPIGLTADVISIVTNRERVGNFFRNRHRDSELPPARLSDGTLYEPENSEADPKLRAQLVLPDGQRDHLNRRTTPPDSEPPVVEQRPSLAEPSHPANGEQHTPSSEDGAVLQDWLREADALRTRRREVAEAIVELARDHGLDLPDLTHESVQRAVDHLEYRIVRRTAVIDGWAEASEAYRNQDGRIRFNRYPSIDDNEPTQRFQLDGARAAGDDLFEILLRWQSLPNKTAPLPPVWHDLFDSDGNLSKSVLPSLFVNALRREQIVQQRASWEEMLAEDPSRDPERMAEARIEMSARTGVGIWALEELRSLAREYESVDDKFRAVSETLVHLAGEEWLAHDPNATQVEHNVWRVGGQPHRLVVLDAALEHDEILARTLAKYPSLAVAVNRGDLVPDYRLGWVEPDGSVRIGQLGAPQVRHLDGIVDGRRVRVTLIREGNGAWHPVLEHPIDPAPAAGASNYPAAHNASAGVPRSRAEVEQDLHALGKRLGLKEPGDLLRRGLELVEAEQLRNGVRAVQIEALVDYARSATEIEEFRGLGQAHGDLASRLGVAARDLTPERIASVLSDPHLGKSARRRIAKELTKFAGEVRSADPAAVDGARDRLARRLGCEPKDFLPKKRDENLKSVPDETGLSSKRLSKAIRRAVRLEGDGPDAARALTEYARTLMTLDESAKAWAGDTRADPRVVGSGISTLSDTAYADLYSLIRKEVGTDEATPEQIAERLVDPSLAKQQRQVLVEALVDCVREVGPDHSGEIASARDRLARQLEPFLRLGLRQEDLYGERYDDDFHRHRDATGITDAKYLTKKLDRAARHSPDHALAEPVADFVRAVLNAEPFARRPEAAPVAGGEMPVHDDTSPAHLRDVIGNLAEFADRLGGTVHTADEDGVHRDWARIIGLDTASEELEKLPEYVKRYKELNDPKSEGYRNLEKKYEKHAKAYKKRGKNWQKQFQDRRRKMRGAAQAEIQRRIKNYVRVFDAYRDGVVEKHERLSPQELARVHAELRDEVRRRATHLARAATLLDEHRAAVAVGRQDELAAAAEAVRDAVQARGVAEQQLQAAIDRVAEVEQDAADRGDPAAPGKPRFDTVTDRRQLPLVLGRLRGHVMPEDTQQQRDAAQERRDAYDELERAAGDYHDAVEAVVQAEKHHEDLAVRDALLSADADPLAGEPRVGIIEGPPRRVAVVVRGESETPVEALEHAVELRPAIDAIAGPNRKNVVVLRVLIDSNEVTTVHREDPPEQPGGTAAAPPPDSSGSGGGGRAGSASDEPDTEAGQVGASGASPSGSSGTASGGRSGPASGESDVAAAQQGRPAAPPPDRSGSGGGRSGPADGPDAETARSEPSAGSAADVQSSGGGGRSGAASGEPDAEAGQEGASAAPPPGTSGSGSGGRSGSASGEPDAGAARSDPSGRSAADVSGSGDGRRSGSASGGPDNEAAHPTPPASPPPAPAGGPSGSTPSHQGSSPSGWTTVGAARPHRPTTFAAEIADCVTQIADQVAVRDRALADVRESARSLEVEHWDTLDADQLKVQIQAAQVALEDHIQELWARGATGGRLYSFFDEVEEAERKLVAAGPHVKAGTRRLSDFHVAADAVATLRGEAARLLARDVIASEQATPVPGQKFVALLPGRPTRLLVVSNSPEPDWLIGRDIRNAQAKNGVAIFFRQTRVDEAGQGTVIDLRPPEAGEPMPQGARAPEQPRGEVESPGDGTAGHTGPRVHGRPDGADPRTAQSDSGRGRRSADGTAHSHGDGAHTNDPAAVHNSGAAVPADGPAAETGHGRGGGQCAVLGLRELLRMFGRISGIRLPARLVGLEGMSTGEIEACAGGAFRDFNGGRADVAAELLGTPDEQARGVKHGAAALVVEMFSGRDAHGVGGHAFLMVNEGNRIVVRDLGIVKEFTDLSRRPGDVPVKAILFDRNGHPDIPIDDRERDEKAHDAIHQLGDANRVGIGRPRESPGEGERARDEENAAAGGGHGGGQPPTVHHDPNSGAPTGHEPPVPSDLDPAQPETLEPAHPSVRRAGAENVASYLFGLELDENLAAPAVYRSVDGPGEDGAVTEIPRNLSSSAPKDSYRIEDQRLMAVHDYVIGIGVRSRDTYATSSEGRPVVIDNPGAFPRRGASGLAHPTIYSDFVMLQLDKPLPADLLAKVRAIDLPTLRSRMLQSGLGRDEIDAMFDRLHEIREHGRITGEAWHGAIDSPDALARSRLSQYIPPHRRAAFRFWDVPTDDRRPDVTGGGIADPGGTAPHAVPSAPADEPYQFSGKGIRYKAQKGKSDPYVMSDGDEQGRLAGKVLVRQMQQSLRDSVGAAAKALMPEFGIRDINHLAGKKLEPAIAAQEAAIDQSSLSDAEKQEKISRLYDLRGIAERYHNIGPNMVDTSRQIGDIPGFAYANDPAVHPNAVVMLPLDTVWEGGGSFDVPLFVPARAGEPPIFKAIENKGLGSPLGTADTPTGRAQQGAPEYYARTLEIEKNLARVLNETPETMRARGIDPDSPAARKLLQARDELLGAFHDGTLVFQYELARTDINGSTTITKFVLERDGTPVSVQAIGGIIRGRTATTRVIT